MSHNQPEQLGFPSVINFLQKEYRKTESERELWELERSEYRSNISTLESFKKSQEKVQYDLLRRIKMLEFALKTERTRNRLLIDRINQTITNEDEKQSITEYVNTVLTHNSLSENQPEEKKALPPKELPPNVSQGLLAGKIPQSSQIIRNLLEEINCSDAWMLLSRPSATAEQMLNDTEFLNAISPLQPSTTKDTSTNELFINGEGKQTTPQPTPQPVQRSATVIVQQKKETPKPEPKPEPTPPVQDTQVDNEEKMGKELQEKYNIKQNDLEKLMIKAGSGRSSSRHQDKKRVSWNFGDEPEPEPEPKEENSFGAETNKALEALNKVKVSTSNVNTPKNEVPTVTSPTVSHRAWKPKFVLASHLDGVRSVDFHDKEPLLLSGSEDRTVKLWNVNKPSKKSNEPIHTFRGHTGPVFVVRCQSDYCFSAGGDNTVRVWTTPQTDNNAYASHGHAEPFSRAVITGHTDAIWSLSVHADHILSASADGTTRLWKYRQIVQENDNVDELLRGITPVAPKHNIYARDGSAMPTCVAHIPHDHNKFIVSHTDSTLTLYDIETQAVLWTTTPPQSSVDNNVIYQCLAHPTLPIIITAHEDSNIRFYDSKSGQMISEMVGHKDAVSCLALDPSGLYFMSGGHDSSLRVWDVQTKHCVQEIPTHRKKYDESIHSIAYHPTKSMVASGGADSIIKLFQ